MVSDNYTETGIYNNEEISGATADVEKYLEPEESIRKDTTTRAEKKAARKAAKGKVQDKPDLTKMKKHELLEIMLAQGKEIDGLRARVSELEAQLAAREFEFSKIGSIAEASLAVTDIFKEAEKAANIYLDNVRRRCE